ncbi:molybdate ABC transporter permease subunit [Candidatus Nitrospira allomarina]|jgi:molybdate transport system permease protein|uniref:Molybdenum transport system permease n=1 Tax=Candidatus Nitrospira allomarina TaxID=3020900 RepID=A0AA96JV66_9BACT|nr:molybdate ABC transporter permease subunit [Candidatus Nitrospira allomarina]WNM56566.1 molybdate ABC transporter permease subunit [Candidatus Nitrospira allomarina]
MTLSEVDLGPLWLTLHLAGVTVIVLLIIGTPIAWWLAHTRSRARTAIEAIVAMPLVLPPTVLGFYLLVLLGPHGWIGSASQAITGSALSFTFTGLVIASALYSLPFVVQPLHSAFEAIGRKPLEAAWSLRASKLDTFLTIVSPMASRGYLTAIVLGFAHTLGEFGVVLMVGGNIPGRTKVLSIAIYDHVEVLEYSQAHVLSAGLLVFSFLVLLLVYSVNRRLPIHVS